MKTLIVLLLSFSFSGSVLAEAGDWHRGECSVKELQEGYKNVGRWVGNPHFGKDYYIYCVRPARDSKLTALGSALVIHPKTGETIGTVESILEKMGQSGATVNQCSGRGCEWIGFCYCPGPHGG